MLLDTDLPYLEPLLFHLQKDENLKLYFTQKSYFMPKDNLVSATKEMIGKDCPAPRALWILPQDNVAINPNGNCLSNYNHTFYILILINCIRDKFQIIDKDGVAHLSGEYMEMTQVRKAIKKSINEFNKETSKIVTGKQFEKIAWVKDQSLYDNDEELKQNFLINNSEFTVKIF